MSVERYDTEQPDISLLSLRAKLSGFVPELSGAEGPSAALLRVFARYLELLQEGLARVPARSELAFLDMLAMELLPAQAARAPIVWKLVPSASADVTLPERSQVAASEEAIFATERSITLCRARLSAIYTVVPGRDAIADHSARATSGFSAFDELEPCEHAIYLGHDQLFALSGDVSLVLAFTLERGAGEPLATRWEYLTESGWLPFASLPEEDTTGKLQHDGQIALRRTCGPDSLRATFAGRDSFWIRGRLASPLLPQEVTGKTPLPVVNDVRASVMFGRDGLSPEAAFADGVALDPTRTFFPFGAQPGPYATFYVASTEVFARKRARLAIAIALEAQLSPSDLTLAWEYFDGSAWRSVNLQGDAAALQLSRSGTLTGLCPADWAKTKVNGIEQYWLRIRISAGDYGQPIHLELANGAIAPAGGTLAPPVLTRFTLGYSYVSDPEPLQHCLSHNDFVFRDHTEASLWPDQSFVPFLLVADRQPAIYLGFDRMLPAGLVSLYVERSWREEDRGRSDDGGSPFIWEYLGPLGYTQLSVLDETSGFERSGMVQFIGPSDAVAADGLGGSLFRVRARFKHGESAEPREIAGVWLNAVWARHDRAAEREPLGVSDGNARQGFRSSRAPIHDGEQLWVKEWSGRGEYWQSFVKGVAPEDLEFERRAADGEISAVWVRWHARSHLHASGRFDRHYTVERARGRLSFGDGTRGMIPPAGRIVALSYRSGGGLAGNVAAGAITQIRSAVPLVLEASNPVAARGGAALEEVDAARARGAQRLRHRGRAIAPSDFEWLAREASPEVARARCFPAQGPAGRAQRGFVTVLIVPRTEEARPSPSRELCERVRAYLAARVSCEIAGRVRVGGPGYTAVSVRAEIVVLPSARPARVEAAVRARLDAFLHPLDGGPRGRGWDFGATLRLSQIASVLEASDGVDYVREIQLSLEDRLFGEAVRARPETLIAAGDHELRVSLGGLA